MARVTVDTTVTLRPIAELLEDCLRMIQEQIDHFKHKKGGATPYTKQEMDCVTQMAKTVRSIQIGIPEGPTKPVTELTDEELEARIKGK